MHGTFHILTYKDMHGFSVALTNDSQLLAFSDASVAEQRITEIKHQLTTILTTEKYKHHIGFFKDTMKLNPKYDKRMDNENEVFDLIRIRDTIQSTKHSSLPTRKKELYL